MDVVIFIVLTILVIFLIRKAANYILDMGFNAGITLSLIVFSGIVLFLFWGGCSLLLFDYFYPNPYECEFCNKTLTEAGL